MGKIMINDINFSGGGPQIDDTTTSNSTTWSSNQTNTEITKVAHNSADEYDSTRTSSNKYNKGDLCIYQNTLYKCNADAGTYGPFDSSKWSSTTLSDELEGKADASTITSFISQLDNVTITHYNCEGNGGLLTLPSYDDFCLIFISRGEGGLYMGHWTGVTPIVNAPNHNVIYYSNPSRINITNNSQTTARITVIRK